MPRYALYDEDEEIEAKDTEVETEADGTDQPVVEDSDLGGQS